MQSLEELFGTGLENVSNFPPPTVDVVVYKNYDRKLVLAKAWDFEEETWKRIAEGVIDLEDSAVINSAIEFLGKRGGGVVKLCGARFNADLVIGYSNVTISGNGRTTVKKIIGYGKTQELDGEDDPIEYLKIDNLICSGIYLRHNVNDFVITRNKITGSGLYADGQAINGTIAFNHFRSYDYNIKFYSETGEDGTRAEGNKVVCNYIDGWHKCKGIFFYNSRNNIVTNNVLDNYYDTPITLTGSMGLGHVVMNNVILVPNSDTAPAIVVEDSQHNIVMHNYITQAATGLKLINTTNNYIGSNQFVAVNQEYDFENSPKSATLEIQNMLAVNGLINKYILTGDYGGNFANFTPPTPVHGMQFIAKDLNSFAPATRLYCCIGSTWEFADIRTNNAYTLQDISLSASPGQGSYGDAVQQTFGRPITWLADIQIYYNVSAGDIVDVDLYTVFQDNTVGTAYTVTIDNSSGTSAITGTKTVTSKEMYVMVDNYWGKSIVGLRAQAKSENSLTTTSQEIYTFCIVS